MYLNLTEEIEKIEHRLMKAINNQSKIVSILKELTLSDDVELLIYDTEKMQFCENQKDHAIALNMLQDSSISLVGEAYHNKKIYFSKYVPYDKKYNIALDNPFNLKINSQIIAPIISDNEVIGILRFSKSHYTYNNEDIKIVLALMDRLIEIFANLRERHDSKNRDSNNSHGFNVVDTYKTIDKIKQHLGRFTISNPEIQKLVYAIHEDVENLTNYIDSLTSDDTIIHKKLTHRDARVLIADDVQMNVKILDAMIRQENIDDISFAYDGDETLEKIEDSIKSDEHIHILFLDHHMPKKLGSEVVDSIRKNIRIQDKIFIVSITNDPKAIEEQKTLYDYHIPKPFKKSDVSNVIKNICSDIKCDQERSV